MGDREVVAIAVYTDGCERLPDGSLLIHDCLNSSQARRLVAAPADIAPWPDAERLASLQAERDQEERDRIRIGREVVYMREWVSVLAVDLGLDAAASLDDVALAIHSIKARRDREVERTATLEAQLALCDAVVEALRPLMPSIAFWATATATGKEAAAQHLGETLAALDASENPRGATEEDAGT